MSEQSRLKAVRSRTTPEDLARSWAAGGLAVQLTAGSGEGDDCAVLELDGAGALVIGSDYIRGTGFRLFELGHLSFNDLGWYLAMANFSDVAAMGATPVGLLTVIRYPKQMDDGDFDAVLAGVADACRVVGANPMGGDIGGAERLFLSASAFGICEAGGALRRSGARPGDLLAITGPVGTPAAAMVYFDRLAPNDQALEASAREELLDAWRRPQARVREGQALAELGAHACQDISDGLRDTVVQLCSASGVGCRIRSAELPIQPSVRGVAALADLDPVALALGASVDFELACAIAPQNVAAQQERFASLGSELHLVGEFTAEQDLILQTPEGDMALPGASWDHATDDPVAAMLEASRRS